MFYFIGRFPVLFNHISESSEHDIIFIFSERFSYILLQFINVHISYFENFFLEYNNLSFLIRKMDIPHLITYFGAFLSIKSFLNLINENIKVIIQLITTGILSKINQVLLS